jgi:hydrogenase expression/formation protein HypE
LDIMAHKNTGTSSDRITLSHGSGGRDSALLMRDVFGKYFSNEILDKLDDGAVLPIPSGICVSPDAAITGNAPVGGGEIVVSTDSFVVTPLEFPGGDIGKLAVCGTVNDVLMMGAVPKYLTCGFIIEAGLEIELLKRIVRSMSTAAAKAGVQIVAGDTKVIEHRGDGGQQGLKPQQTPGLFINTTGIGIPRALSGHDALSKNSLAPPVPVAQSSSTIHPAPPVPVAQSSSTIHPAPPTPVPLRAPSGQGARPGDALIVSGTLGDHHACILSARMGIKNGIKSDCMVLKDIPDALYAAGIDIHTMRDVTRGGLGTVINEIATASDITIELAEEHIPVNPEVKAFCGIMGLDPIYMGNEGKLIIIVPERMRQQALDIIRKTQAGKEATLIGRCYKRLQTDPDAPRAIMRTKIGGTRRIDMLTGEGLPRIC